MILYSDKYDLFEFRHENRPLATGHVDNLARRIAEHGYSKDAAIVVSKTSKGKLSIVDGQHRFSACKQLKIKVPYVLIDEKDASSKIIERNTFSKTWSLGDFARFYAELGNESYRRLVAFKARYHIEYRDAFSLLAPPGKRLYRDVAHDFKDGKFFADQRSEELAIQRMDLVNDILNFNDYTRAIPKTSSLSMAAIRLISHPDYEHHRMMACLGTLSTRFVKCVRQTEYRDMLASIYNYKLRTGKISFPDNGKMGGKIPSSNGAISND